MNTIQLLNFRIILEKPTKGVDFCLQEKVGKTTNLIQKQRGNSNELIFNFIAKIKGDISKDSLPDFSGSFVNGITDERFVYIGIGKHAHQFDSCWDRRLKVPLRGISWEDLRKYDSGSDKIFVAEVSGIGKDGTPNCGTVKPFEGWKIIEI